MVARGRRRIALAAMSGIVLAGGCADGNEQGLFGLFGPTQSEDPRSTKKSNEAVPAAFGPTRRPAQLAVRFDVLRVRVRQGTTSGSEKIWNHVNEQVIPIAKAQQLRFNGFRVGLITSGAWPAIKAIFDGTEGATARQTSSVISDGSPLTIQLTPVCYQTIFHYRLDMTLVGRSFYEGATLLRIDHSINPDRLSELTLGIVPEIRQPGVSLRWKSTPDGIRQVPVYRGELLAALACQIALPSGTGVVIGPSEAIAQETLIGRALLAEEINAEPYERVLFITPTVIRLDTTRP